MTNNQIIRNEAARLDPATLHAIATAHHTPDEIAAIAAACKTTDENGNEQRKEQFQKRFEQYIVDELSNTVPSKSCA